MSKKIMILSGVGVLVVFCVASLITGALISSVADDNEPTPVPTETAVIELIVATNTIEPTDEPTATSEPPTAVPTDEPTATSEPTNTPRPTWTPRPTRTPRPTATPQPEITAQEMACLLQTVEYAEDSANVLNIFTGDFSMVDVIEAQNFFRESAVQILLLDCGRHQFVVNDLATIFLTYELAFSSVEDGEIEDALIYMDLATEMMGELTESVDDILK